jgi:hypothetical protein
VKVYVGVTDKDWYQFLARLKERRRAAGEDLEEVNFWKPKGKLFKALQPGDLFLFNAYSGLIRAPIPQRSGQGFRYDAGAKSGRPGH